MASPDNGASTNVAGTNVAGTWPQRLVVLVPYLWLAIFFLLPFVIVVKLSLSETAIAQPPYVPVLDPALGLDGLKEFLA
jgi:putrescine transport system permease protein